METRLVFSQQVLLELSISSSPSLRSCLLTSELTYLALLHLLLLIAYRWGRRKILLLGAAGMGISQLLVGTLYAVYRNRWETNTNAGWAAAVFIWIYIANFAYSIGKLSEKIHRMV